MFFATNFCIETGVALFVCAFLFGIPGILGIRALGMGRKPEESWALLLAPVCGICLYGSFSLLVCSLLGYSAVTLLLAWIGLSSLLWRAAGQEAEPSVMEPFDFAFATPRQALFVAACAALLALFTAAHIYPITDTTGPTPALYVGDPIFDHAKVAIIDALAREGLPPVSPYYAEAGRSVPLSYYFGWHFCASQARVLIASLSGWACDVAFTVFSAWAAMALMAGVAGWMGRTSRAGVFALLLAMAGPLYRAVEHPLGDRFRDLAAPPPLHGLETLFIQMCWVPQHVCGAAATVFLLFLAARALAGATPIWFGALAIGASAACIFSNSLWIAIAFCLVLPFLLIALVAGGVCRKGYRRLALVVPVAAVVALILSAPVLISVLAGGSADGEGRFPVEFWLKPASRYVLYTKVEVPDGPDQFLFTPANAFWNVILYWFQYLPFQLGVAVPAGVVALALRRTPVPPMRLFRWLALLGGLGMSAVPLFLRSVILNNDLGWRAILPAYLLWSIGAAMLLGDLFGPLFYRSRWLVGEWFARHRLAIGGTLLCYVGYGLLASVAYSHIPYPLAPKWTEKDRQARRRFYEAREAWTMLRMHTDSRDLILTNPDAGESLTPWPCNLPWALFSNRRSAFASEEFVHAYARQVPEATRDRLGEEAHRFFSQHSDEALVCRIHDEWKVRAVMVESTDGIWEKAEHFLRARYRRVWRGKDYKVYISHEGGAAGD